MEFGVFPMQMSGLHFVLNLPLPDRDAMTPLDITIDAAISSLLMVSKLLAYGDGILLWGVLPGVLATLLAAAGIAYGLRHRLSLTYAGRSVLANLELKMHNLLHRRR